jgi:hypothetical protein
MRQDVHERVALADCRRLYAPRNWSGALISVSKRRTDSAVLAGTNVNVPGRLAASYMGRAQ